MKHVPHIASFFKKNGLENEKHKIMLSLILQVLIRQRITQHKMK